jgi:hypothetical protein
MSGPDPAAPPSLEVFVTKHGGYDKITPEAWAQFDAQMARWQETVRDGGLRPCRSPDDPPPPDPPDDRPPPDPKAMSLAEVQTELQRWITAGLDGEPRSEADKVCVQALWWRIDALTR